MSPAAPLGVARPPKHEHFVHGSTGSAPGHASPYHSHFSLILITEATPFHGEGLRRPFPFPIFPFSFSSFGDKFLSWFSR